MVWYSDAGRPDVGRPWATRTSTVYRLCERSLGTFACCPAQKKKEKTQKVTSILFRSYCLYVCVLGSCVRVFNNHRPTWKKTRKQTEPIPAGRGGSLSSPVLLCNESYLGGTNQKHEEETASWTKMVKVMVVACPSSVTTSCLLRFVQLRLKRALFGAFSPLMGGIKDLFMTALDGSKWFI